MVCAASWAQTSLNIPLDFTPNDCECFTFFHLKRAVLKRAESVQEIRADQADIVISLYLYLTVYCYSSRSLGENKYLLAKYILIWYEVAVMQYIYVKVVYLATNYFKLLMKTVDDLRNWFWYAQAEEGVGFLCWLYSPFFLFPLTFYSALRVGKQ